MLLEEAHVTPDDTEATVRARLNDLTQRYEFHGSSLRLVEEILHDTELLNDVPRMHQLFSSAFAMAPVSVPFFQYFSSKTEFMEGFTSSELFSVYYQGACLTMSPVLWSALVEVAQLPEVDFSENDLARLPSISVTTSGGAPLLFPTPDMFFGCLDFIHSLALFNHLRQKQTQEESAEVEDLSANALLALSAGTEISPLEQLLVSALSVAGHHTTANGLLWHAARERAVKSLSAWLERFDASDPTLDDEALLNIWGESWNVRVLFFRQLNIASPNLADVLDEYKLFEHQLPDAFRLLDAPPLNLALEDEAVFKEQVLSVLKERVAATATPRVRLDPSDRDLSSAEPFLSADPKLMSGRSHGKEGRAVETRRGSDSRKPTEMKRCMEVAEKLMERSQESWKKLRKFESLEGESGTSSSESTDEDMDDEIAVDLLMGGGRHKRRRSSSGSGWEAASLREKECRRWTKEINACESDAARQKEALLCRQRTKSVRHHSLLLPPESPNDLLSIIFSALSDRSTRLAHSRRRVAVTYFRAIEEVGSLRLDLFSSFWDFLAQHTRDEVGLVPADKWVGFWTSWCADLACRFQPLKSCCWARAFGQVQHMALSDMDGFKSFMTALMDGPYWKALHGPNWWKINEIVPPPLECTGAAVDETLEWCVPTMELLQTYTSEFLNMVYEAVRVVESAYKSFFSQDKIFIKGGATNGNTESGHTDETPDLAHLLESISQILSLAESRIFDFLEYLTPHVQDKTAEPMISVFATSTLSLKILKGIFLARLRRPSQELMAHLDSISVLNDLFSTLFDSASGTGDPLNSTNAQLFLGQDASEGSEDTLAETSLHEALVNTVCNVKVGLALSSLVCEHARHFQNLKGTWIFSCLVRGDYSPRIVSKAFLEQVFDVAFESIFTKLSSDEEPLLQHPLLAAKCVEVAAIASSVLDELPPENEMRPVLSWLTELEQAVTNKTSWSAAPNDLPPVTVLPVPQLPPPVSFPKMGAPVRVALEGLKGKPFCLQPTLSQNGAPSLDYQSVAGSSSSSSSGPAKRVPNASRMTSPLVRSTSPGRIVASPTRRLSVEEVELLTRATFDGREAILPSLAPAVIPPALPHSEDLLPASAHPVVTATSDYPLVHSPILRRRRSSLSKRVQDDETPHIGERSSSEDNTTAVDQLVHDSELMSEKLPTQHHRMREPPIAEGNLYEKTSGQRNPGDTMMQDAAARNEADAKSTAVQARVGNHYRQQSLDTKGLSKDLFETKIEWNTVWLNNLDTVRVSENLLRNEMRSLDCQGLKEIRLIKDAEGRNKGFAYIDFDTPEHAHEAVKKLDKRRIQEREVNAAISVPKSSVYEKDVIFVCDIPKDTSQTLLRSLFKRAFEEFSKQEPDRGRKRAAESSGSGKKRVRPHSDLVIPQYDDDTSTQEESAKSVVKPVTWDVKDIRMRVERSGDLHAYVQFLDFRAVLEILAFDRTAFADDIFVRFVAQQLLLAFFFPGVTLTQTQRSFFMQRVQGQRLTLSPSIPMKKWKPREKTDDSKQQDTADQNKQKAATLYVSNLSMTMKEEELTNLFGDYGAISRVHMPKDPKNPSHNRRFALVEFTDALDASVALSALDGHEIGKSKGGSRRRIEVKQATEAIRPHKFTEHSREQTSTDWRKPKPRHRQQHPHNVQEREWRESLPARLTIDSCESSNDKSAAPEDESMTDTDLKALPQSNADFRAQFLSSA